MYIHKNLYKIHSREGADPFYFLSSSLKEAIASFKERLQTKKDPEIIEWIADSVYDSTCTDSNIGNVVGYYPNKSDDF